MALSIYTYICDNMVRSLNAPYGIEDRSLPCRDLKRNAKMFVKLGKVSNSAAPFTWCFAFKIWQVLFLFYLFMYFLFWLNPIILMILHNQITYILKCYLSFWPICKTQIKMDLFSLNGKKQEILLYIHEPCMSVSFAWKIYHKFYWYKSLFLEFPG